MRNIHLFTTFLFSFSLIVGQVPRPSLVANISRNKANHIKFVVDALPSLTPIAGAQAPRYEHLTVFGDGQLSFKKGPKHVYSSPGTYLAEAFVSPVYSDDVPPPIGNRRIVIDLDSLRGWENADIPNSLLGRKETVGLQHFRAPAPEREIIFVLSYANKFRLDSSISGRIFFFFNEKAFPYDCFHFKDFRAYNGESIGVDSSAGVWSAPEFMGDSARLPINYSEISGLNNAKAAFDHSLSIRVEDLAPEAEKNLLLFFEGDSSMVVDSASTVHVRTVFVPDRRGDGDLDSDYLLGMEILVGKDPNYLTVDQIGTNEDEVGKGGIVYTVHFANTGRGTARNVKVELELDRVLDFKRVEVLDHYPYPLPCEDTSNGRSCLKEGRRGNTLMFEFLNVYIPGKDDLDFDEDDTKGFIKVLVRSNLREKQKRIPAKAKITFDNEVPILTNGVESRLLRSRRSIGVRGRLLGLGDAPLLGNIDFANGVEIDYSIYYVKPLGASIGLGFDNYGRNQNINGTTALSTLRFAYLKATFLKVRIDVLRNISLAFGVEQNYYLFRKYNGEQVSQSNSGSFSSEKFFLRITGDLRWKLIPSQFVFGIRFGYTSFYTTGFAHLGPYFEYNLKRNGKRNSNPKTRSFKISGG